MHLTDYGPGDRKYYQDVIHVKYVVKKISTGVILQDTQNFTSINNRNELISMRTNPSDNNSLSVYYSGTNCGVGWGEVIFKKISANQISWSFYPESTLLTSESCPGNPDIKVYLPDTKDLIFTKQ